MEWNDLRIILAICRAGSLTGAAKALQVNKSTVLRQINTIEQKMGVRFFDRVQQGYLMTEAGEAVMHTASRMDEEAISLERELLGRDFRFQGDIRLTAPEGIATLSLTPLIAAFCKEHPEIHIELITTNAPLELSRREADLAVRVTNKPPDTSLGRRISEFNFCVYAAPRYLKKHPGTKLAEHNWVAIIDEVDWLIPLIWKKKEEARQKIVFSGTSTLNTLNCAKQGMGVILLPCFLGDAENGLTRVGKPIKELASELWVLTHPDLRQTARVRALMTFIYESLKEQSHQFAGNLR
ncbi:LysR family transcriptional regulator [Kaarinaea lacus]